MTRLEAGLNFYRTEEGECAHYVHRWRAFALIIMLVLTVVAGPSMFPAVSLCQEQASRPVHTSRSYWIGKNISEAEKEFGTPTFSEQLVETGGMLVIYASKKDPVHFVFETDASGMIVKAARVE
jgi:hypothetical protein